MKHNYKTVFCSMRNMFGRSTSPTRKNAKFSSISQQSTSVSKFTICRIGLFSAFVVGQCKTCFCP